MITFNKLNQTSIKFSHGVGDLVNRLYYYNSVIRGRELQPVKELVISMLDSNLGNKLHKMAAVLVTGMALSAFFGITLSCVALHYT